VCGTAFIVLIQVGLNKNKQWTEWFKKAQGLRSKSSKYIRGTEYMNEDTKGHECDCGGEK